MPDSFLDQFYNAVNSELGDPSISKRLTKAQKLADLQVAEKVIWEELMPVMGQAGTEGRTEATVTLEDGRQHYPLPGNFRKFLAFEYRDPDDESLVLAYLPSIPEYENTPGVQILSEQRGMMVKPTPELDDDQDWTLVYLKGPVILHNATAGTVANMPTSQVLTGYSVTTTKVTKSDTFTKAMIGETVTFSGGALAEAVNREITAATADYIEFAAVTGLDDTASMTIDADWCWLVAGAPAADNGTIIKIDDYYNGSLLRVYDATLGYPQTREIIDFYADPTTTTEWHFKLRHPWSPVPTGAVKYEIRPALPQDYDRLYAVDVALMQLDARINFVRKGQLEKKRRKLLQACRSYFDRNVADRIARVSYPPDEYAHDPYD